MPIPFTFRKRILLYTLFLMTLLIGFLLFFYQLGKDAILETADRNTELSATQIEGKLHSRYEELDRHLRMISENLQLREYMFIVVSIGGNKEPLQKLYDHLYGWVPFDRIEIVSSRGQILIGEGDPGIQAELKKLNLFKDPKKTNFYISGNGRLEIIKVAPVYYQNQFLGNIVISHDLAKDLIQSARQTKYGQIFIVENNKIAESTINSAVGKPFNVRNKDFSFGGISYRLHPVNLPVNNSSVSVWFGLSDVDLLTTLNRSEKAMFFMALVASLIVVIVSYLTFVRFSKPVDRLVSLMESVGEGRLPNVDLAANNDEIGYLTNQFKDMVSNLRRQQQEIEKVHEKLEQQATTDELTGFYNRRFLYNIYPKLWSEANRQRKTMGVILADIDHFKMVNDTHGHLTGDEILKQFATIINQCSRVSDFLIRMGGEEFLVLTSEGIESAQILAEKIRSRLERTPMQTSSGEIRITCSFGIAQAEISDGKDSLSAVLRRADLALYRAKDSGRNRVAIWDEKLKRA